MKLLKGFTLIEMLIVMSIMAVVMSLVGPLTIEFINKSQAQSEFISLKNQLKKISFLAFSSANEQKVILRNSSLIVSSTTSSPKTIIFTHLRFPEQQVNFNASGYPFPEKLQVRKLKSAEEINLFRLIEGTEYDKPK